MKDVNIRLRDVIMQGRFAAPPHEADETLRRWGRLIRETWEKDNLLLFVKETEPAVHRVVHVVQSFHEEVRLSRQERQEGRESRARTDEKLAQVMAKLTRLEGRVMRDEAVPTFAM